VDFEGEDERDGSEVDLVGEAKDDCRRILGRRNDIGMIYGRIRSRIWLVTTRLTQGSCKTFEVVERCGDVSVLSQRPIFRVEVHKGTHDISEER
jgi:hypothetical protein